MAESKDAKNFDCFTCKINTKKIRKCAEPREDFTSDDSVIFPMYVSKGGALYGFCPGKATWDKEAVAIFKQLVISAETGCQYVAGGLEDQPMWWLDLLSWFIPRYNDSKFAKRVKSIVGDDAPKSVLSKGMK